MLFPSVSKAQSLANPSSTLQEGVQIIQQPLGLPATDIRVIVANIIKAALGLLGIIAVVIIMYAGFLWMTAGGNEEQIGKAKSILINGVIGLAIILSAYAIVSFIFGMLGVGTGNNNGGSGLGAPIVGNYSGSGALGGIIKDHYPRRDQTGVPRNTKIVITFRQPILLSSFVDNNYSDPNNPNQLGDCKPDMTNWNTDCDHVRTGTDGKLSDTYINIKRTDNGQSISGAVILAASSTENGVSGVYTIVLKPITDTTLPSGGYLGSSTSTVGYTVHLGSAIRLDDAANNNPSAFQQAVLGNNYYEWKFTNSTVLDTQPPYITDVFPAANTTEAKNSIFQINFSEPMDPTGIQGDFSSSSQPYYALDGNNVFLQTLKSSLPAGTFNLTNGYQTLEFTPSKECGKNACGNKIYCLPVCDNTTDPNCTEDTYSLLLKAAQAINSSTFEAQPFSGLMDLSGNALDGNNNNRPERAPTILPVFPNQEHPDNYYWSFIINDQIDASSPYLQRVLPGKDAQWVSPDQEWSMLFSKRMRTDSMYDIGLNEYPAPTSGIPLWKVPFSQVGSSSTYTKFFHGPFLNTARQYYFPIVSSSVEDVHFNCFYPGEGPNQTAIPDTLASPVCNEQNRDQCCLTYAAQNQNFCCNGDAVSSSVSACLTYWRSRSL